MSKKILVVEDEKIQMEAMLEFLTESGFEVQVAGDGKKGLDKALKEHPDLILLDIMMPVMDGIEMLKELRKDEWGKTAKIILLSNADDTNKVADALGEGVYDYMVKSDTSMEDVVERINSKLKTNL